MKNDPPGVETLPLSEAQAIDREQRVAAGRKAMRAARYAAAVDNKPAAVGTVRITASAPRIYSPLHAHGAPKALTKKEQANAAVAYSKAHGVSVLQAIKTLGFAS